VFFFWGGGFGSSTSRQQVLASASHTESVPFFPPYPLPEFIISEDPEQLTRHVIN